jgi:hypothetical protein
MTATGGTGSAQRRSLQHRLLRVRTLLPAAGLLTGGRWRIVWVLGCSAWDEHHTHVNDGTKSRVGSLLGSGGIESAHECIGHGRRKRSGSWWYEVDNNQRLALRCTNHHATFERVCTRSRQRPLGAQRKRMVPYWACFPLRPAMAVPACVPASASLR